MTNQSVFEQSELTIALPTVLRKGVCGFVFWALFLLVLEPGNAMRAARAGHALGLPHEATRIAVAAALGTLIVPLLLVLTRHFPLWGARRWQHVLVHLGGSAVMAFGLIAISCVLSAWFLDGQLWPTIAQLRDQLVGNWLLLSFAILALIGALHVASAFRPTEKRSDATQPQRRMHISVTTHGRVHLIALSSVDWIETQGNYQALHVGAHSHLVRDTAARFDVQLEGSQFVRIHRRACVAVDRIASIRRLDKGDSQVTLTTGQEIRANRRYREALWDRWRTYSQLQVR